MQVQQIKNQPVLHSFLAVIGIGEFDHKPVDVVATCKDAAVAELESRFPLYDVVEIQKL